MRAMSLEDRKYLVVGRPIPFSVYSTDRTLLLAAGRMVPNEFVREGLLRSGVFRGNEDGTSDTEAKDAPPPGSDSIAALQADYQHTHARAMVGFRMEHENQMLMTRVIGVSDDGHGLIMSEPASLNGASVSLLEGETWTFRAFYAVAAVRFQGIVEKVITHPFPYFYVSHISDIERRTVRQWPRTPTCLWGARAGEPPRIIVDLSVGGARIAVDDRSHLQQGQILLLHTGLQLSVGRKEMTMDATVLNQYGRADGNHPQVEFYGVRFENLSDTQRLILHAYVQEQLCMEFDRVSHVLALAH